MISEEITSRLINGLLNIIIGLILLFFSMKHFSKKQRSTIEKYLGYFYILLGLNFLFIIISILSKQDIFFFISRICLTFSVVVVLDLLRLFGFNFIKKYYLIYFMIFVSIFLSYSDTFIYGGLQGTENYLFFRFPTFIISGLGLISVGYFLNSAFMEFKNRFAVGLISWSFVFQGILLGFLYPGLLISNYQAPAGYALTLLNILIAIGYFILSKESTKDFKLHLKMNF